jgi:hypothetical protein
MPSSLLLLCFFLCRSCSLTAGWRTAAAVLLLLPLPVLLLSCNVSSADTCSGADMDCARDGAAAKPATTAEALCSVVSWVADTCIMLQTRKRQIRALEEKPQVLPAGIYAVAG